MSGTSLRNRVFPEAMEEHRRAAWARATDAVGQQQGRARARQAARHRARAAPASGSRGLVAQLKGLGPAIPSVGIGIEKEGIPPRRIDLRGGVPDAYEPAASDVEVEPPQFPTGIPI